MHKRQVVFVLQESPQKNFSFSVIADPRNLDLSARGIHTTDLWVSYGESMCHQELEKGKAGSERLILMGFRGDAAQPNPAPELPGGCRGPAPAPSSGGSETNIYKALLPPRASAAQFQPSLNPDNVRGFEAAVARLLTSCLHGAVLKGNPLLPGLVSYFPC